MLSKDCEPFIASILEEPDSAASYLVFADWLEEKGDPRAEFIRLQWQLEEPSSTSEERKQLKTREKELLSSHSGEWLGPLADELVHGILPENMRRYRGTACEYSFERGFLSRLCFNMLSTVSENLIKMPLESSLVRSLEVHDGEVVVDLEQIQWPNLRRFTIAGFVDGEIHDFVRALPRLESLDVRTGAFSDQDQLLTLPLPQLREVALHETTGDLLTLLAENETLTNLESIDFFPHVPEEQDESYLNLPGLTALCQASHLRQLKHISLWGSDFGNEGLELLLNSSLHTQLETLDLTYGAITDECIGCLEQADLNGLKQLNLTGNYLSNQGIETIRGLGVQLVAGAQLTGNPDDLQHLYFGDME